MVVDNLYYNNSDSDSSPNAPFTFPDEVIRRALLNIYSQDFHLTSANTSHCQKFAQTKRAAPEKSGTTLDSPSTVEPYFVHTNSNI